MTKTSLISSERHTILLRAVIKEAEQLVRCEDFDAVCRAAVELSRDLIGLDRVGIFLDDGDMMRGTYGTDTKGNTTDERSYRVPKNGAWMKLLAEDDPSPWIYCTDPHAFWRVTDEESAMGGWGVITPIMNSHGVAMGAFCYDASISGRPFDAAVQDVVLVLCLMLGPFLETKQAEEAARAREERFRQSQKMEAVGRLAGGVAHEFNNLLTSILGYGDLILERPELPESVRPDLQQIMVAGERASSLTRQLLALAHRQIAQVCPVDLNATVKQMGKLLHRTLGRDVDLRVVLADDPATIEADPGHVEQVLMNLAVNAADAMPHGGRLTLATSIVSPGPTQDAREFVALSVRDTGAGMDKDILRHMFEPFFTTKVKGKGTGLGLSTVHGIVTQAGGYIECHSEPGSGTEFCVYFPRLSGDAATLAAPGSAAVGGSERILVVEDDRTVRELAVRLLGTLGYSLTEAESGAAALRKLERMDTPVELVITDVVMPGMDGDVLARRILELCPDIRILFMTGFPDHHIVQDGLANAEDPVLFKPFTRASLSAKVRQVLDNRLSPAVP